MVNMSGERGYLIFSENKIRQPVEVLNCHMKELFKLNRRRCTFPYFSQNKIVNYRHSLRYPASSSSSYRTFHLFWHFCHYVITIIIIKVGRKPFTNTAYITWFLAHSPWRGCGYGWCEQKDECLGVCVSCEICKAYVPVCVCPLHEEYCSKNLLLGVVLKHYYVYVLQSNESFSFFRYLLFCTHFIRAAHCNRRVLAKLNCTKAKKNANTIPFWHARRYYVQLSFFFVLFSVPLSSLFSLSICPSSSIFNLNEKNHIPLINNLHHPAM